MILSQVKIIGNCPCLVIHPIYRIKTGFFRCVLRCLTQRGIYRIRLRVNAGRYHLPYRIHGDIHHYTSFFLLLIFFMITSTVVSPNAIKVLLPQGKQQTSAKPLTRVVIDKDLNFYAAFGNEKEQPVALNDLTSFLQSCAEKEPEMYVALYADESVPYREIVRVLNIANENHFKMVLATRPPENK